MKVAFYKKLQDDFGLIRDFQETSDQEKYDAAVVAIKEARIKISMHSVPSLGYKLLCLIGIAALLLPQIIY